MIPISAVVGISALGYLLDQKSREKEFENNNENNEIPVGNIDGCADQYPWNFVETFDDYQASQGNQGGNQNSNIPNNIMKDGTSNVSSVSSVSSISPSPLTPVPINGPTNIEAINNAGNPPPEYLLNAKERPIEDFTHNNMVPFFRGTSTNQNMFGTGVAQANVNSENFNVGNDYSTPNNTTLSTFVGCDDTYLHKREVPNMFSPLERRDKATIPGEDPAGQRPLRDRFTTSILTKNDEAPFERIQVGPGINVDADLPNDGQGYNSGISTRIKPNNVNAYRLTQLPGRIAGTKYQASNLPTALPGTGPSFESYKNSRTNDQSIENINGEIDSQKLISQGTMYGVPQKKESISSISTLDRRPLTATPAVTQAPMHYSNYIMPSATDKRTVTNVQFGQSVEIK